MTHHSQDQQEDMVEWLVHHMAVGVGHFYMCVVQRAHVAKHQLVDMLRYDDYSDPPLRNVLEPWIQSNLVTYLNMAYNVSQVGSKDWQLVVHQHCIDMFSIRHEWLGFIDPDEFIYLTNPQHARLHDLLVKEFDQYSGLVMTWKVYGSSGHVHRPNGVLTDCWGVLRFMPTSAMHTGTVMHSYTKCMPPTTKGGTVRLHKVLMHVAHGQNMAVFTKDAHIAQPTVRQCNAHPAILCNAVLQGTAHPNVSRDAESRSFGPVVDEFKQTVKTLKRKDPTTNVIAVLHYRIKSKEVCSAISTQPHAWLPLRTFSERQHVATRRFTSLFKKVSSITQTNMPRQTARCQSFPTWICCRSCKTIFLQPSICTHFNGLQG